MARVRLIHPEEAEGEAARFLQGSIQLRGRATNAARAWANIPHVAKYYLPFGATLQREGLGGVLSSRIKEMVIIKTSQVNGCDY